MGQRRHPLTYGRTGAVAERGDTNVSPAKARSAPSAKQPLDTGCRWRAGPSWCRWDRKTLGPSGDLSEEEEGRWICFTKGVGLLAVGGLLYAAVPLACHGGLSRHHCDFSQYLHLCLKPRFECVVVTSLLYIAYYEEQKLSHLLCLTSCFECFGSSFAVCVASDKAEESC